MLYINVFGPVLALDVLGQGDAGLITAVQGDAGDGFENLEFVEEAF